MQSERDSGHGHGHEQGATEVYDVILVGGGPAGCVLAARLTADGTRRVLLLEAGPDYGSDPTQWPERLLNADHAEVDTHSWGYHHALRAEGTTPPLPRGRVIGGCSSVNACIWLRGSRLDYEDWEARGNPGWGWDDMLRCFQRAERDLFGAATAPDGGIHGVDGLVPVYRASEDELSQVDRALEEAALEHGFEAVADHNDSPGQRPGVGRTPKNVVDGSRWNAALTYLSVARQRDNLTVVPEALVDRVLVDERDGARVATGVVTADGRTFQGREVILTGGSYGSPAVLLRSGIGPRAHLEEVGVPVVHDLAGVGEHLLDHPYLAPYTSRLTTFPIREEAVMGRRIFVQQLIKARSSQVDEEIDLHLYPREIVDEATGRWVAGIAVSLQYARSKGRVRLRSRDPEAPLDIDHRWFSDPADLEAMVDGLELVMRLATTPPLAGLLDADPEIRTLQRDREALRELARTDVGTTFHPSSTCRMGPADDATAVVDNHGRVYGIQGLRVADASIFPWGPRCNLHWPVVATAERIAELIDSERTA